MNITDKITELSEECVKNAEICLEVGDPFMVDSFRPILNELANYVLLEAQAALSQINIT